MVLEFVGVGLESFLQRCNGCNSILDYGNNTRFDRKVTAHVCNGCGNILR